jgi:hypothetical protein
MVVNDHVVGFLGVAFGAPIGRPQLVFVPQDLIDMEPEMRHMPSGPAHGSQVVEHCGEAEAIVHLDQPGNRERFALLTVLFGWLGGADHQFIYENSTSLVHSVDHGHFFPGGPGWTSGTLAAAPQPEPDSRLMTECAITAKDLSATCPGWAGVDDQTIARAVAAPPDEWQMSEAERVDLATWVAGRRDRMMADLCATGGADA